MASGLPDECFLLGLNLLVYTIVPTTRPYSVVQRRTRLDLFGYDLLVRYP